MLTLSVFVILMASATVTSQAPEGYQQETEVNELKDQLAELKDVVAKLSRYAMMQQFSAEERVRSEGASGVNIVRGDTLGMYDYYTNTHVGHGMMAVHDHSNYDRTVGQGELVAVLNGVSFSTRHNDYRMVMASPNSTDFHAVQDVPFPGVPPQVTEKLTVPEQITEMQEWFKAFAEQNHTLRDYREYFKPVLCYLEGTWTINDKFKEPFHSDRHHLEAGSWEELTGKVRYSSYTGSKSRMENFAYLPTIMMSINETTGVPEYAQWNYRMLCSPLKEDVPLSDLRPVDDLSYRVASGQSRDSILNSRRARFTFYEEDEKRFPQYTKLDRLFHTIPGLDNGPADLHQDSYGQQVLSMAPSTTDRPLNTGYYHRMFKSDRKGAMGIKKIFRGFNDPNLWVAETTQEEVAPISLTTRHKDWRMTESGERKWKKWTETQEARFSYAIPLEIIYLTPLLTWNPYKIAIHERGGVIPEADSRNGGKTKETAYNGANFNHYYLTPAEFFAGHLDRSDPADTVRGSVGVLDQNGEVQVTAASGIKVILQNIPGVGNVRMRYPIAPVHGEGSTVYKELNALKTKLEEENPSYQ